MRNGVLAFFNKYQYWPAALPMFYILAQRIHVWPRHG